MLIARAPVRISLGGGGTDLAAYYRQYGGLVLSWAISKWAIDVRWSAPWVEVASELAMATVLVAGVGLAASIDVLRRRPLAALRAE